MPERLLINYCNIFFVVINENRLVDKKKLLSHKYCLKSHFNDLKAKSYNNFSKNFIRMKHLKHYFFSGISIAVVAMACTASSDTTSSEESGNWVKRSSFEGYARTEAVSFVIGDTAYVGTGYDGTIRLNDFWKYDVTTNQWTQKANFPGVARNSAIAFATSTKGYVGTGYDGINKLKDFWEYNPTNNSWTQKANFGGSARYEAVGFTLNNLGYISTGYDGNNLKDLWQYNPLNDSWIQKQSLGGDKRSSSVVFVYNNKAYITTGINNGTYLNDLWMYDASTETWIEKRNISNYSSDSYDDDYSDIVRNNAVGFVIDDKAYLTTGENGAYTKKTWVYNFSADLWERKTAYERSERNGAVAFTVKGKGFITTGRNSTYYFDNMDEFKPLESYESND